MTNQLDPIVNSSDWSKPEPAPSVTGEEDDPSGYAQVFLDNGKKHASVQTFYKGNVIHSHQWDPYKGWTRGYEYSEEEFSSGIILTYTIPLPDARNAQNFQIATMGISSEGYDRGEFTFGQYNLTTRSCVTYVADVLIRATDPTGLETLTGLNWSIVASGIINGIVGTSISTNTLQRANFNSILSRYAHGWIPESISTGGNQPPKPNSDMDQCDIDDDLDRQPKCVMRRLSDLRMRPVLE